MYTKQHLTLLSCEQGKKFHVQIVNITHIHKKSNLGDTPQTEQYTLVHRSKLIEFVIKIHIHGYYFRVCSDWLHMGERLRDFFCKLLSERFSEFLINFLIYKYGNYELCFLEEKMIFNLKIPQSGI